MNYLSIKMIRYNQKINYIIFLCGVCLWGIGYKLSNFSIGNYGLINSFHIFYILSFSLMIMAIILFAINQSETNYFGIIILFISFIILINGSPLFFEFTPRNSHSFTLYQQADYILKFGFLSPSNQLWYHSWPGLFILTTIIQHITKIDQLTLLSLVPIASGILLFFFALIIFEIISYQKGNEAIWFSSLLLVIFNFLDLNYYTPSNMGFLFFIALLFFLFKLHIARSNKTYVDSAIIILLFTSLVITHILTPVAYLLIIVSLIVLDQIKSNYNKINKFIIYESKQYFSLFILLMVLFLTWIITGGIQQLEVRLPQYISELINYRPEERVVPVVSSKGPLANIQQLRILMMGILLLFASIGTLIGWRNKKKGLISFCYTIIFSLSVLMFIFGYGGETRQRVYIYSLIPLVMLCSLMINYKLTKIILISFLIVIAPYMHFVTHYGNEVLYYVSKSEVIAADWFFNNIQEGTIFAGGLSLVKYKYGNFKYQPIPPNWNVQKLTKGCYIWLNESFDRAIKSNGFEQNKLFYSYDFYKNTKVILNNYEGILKLYDNNYVQYFYKT